MLPHATELRTSLDRGHDVMGHARSVVTEPLTNRIVDTDDADPDLVGKPPEEETESHLGPAQLPCVGVDRQVNPAKGLQCRHNAGSSSGLRRSHSSLAVS